MVIFRMGLLGAGRMGRTHLRALAGSDILRWSPSPTPWNRPARPSRLRESPSTPTSPRCCGQAAWTASSSPLQRHSSRRHRQAGCGWQPILCEKPCGLSSRQGQESAAVVAAAKVRLQVAYWRRFVPSLRKLKTRVVAGELGDLYLVACYRWDEQPPAPSFRTSSGGIFMDMAVHEFDQIRWLSGQEIGRLHAAAARTLFDPPVPGDAVSAQVLCALSGGATALVSLGRRFPLGAGCKVEVFGTTNAEEQREGALMPGCPRFGSASSAMA
jgi:myo-inositol 2-dehydrogenase/D-chiro-inositol 1-dehydrogenase